MPTPPAGRRALPATLPIETLLTIICCKAGAVQANSTELWDRLYQRRLIVSEKMLAEGRGNLGNTERLERFMHKLMAGAALVRGCAVCAEQQQLLKTTS